MWQRNTLETMAESKPDTEGSMCLCNDGFYTEHIAVTNVYCHNTALGQNAIKPFSEINIVI